MFVKRRLKPSERKRFLYITRGFPQLRKLREIMEHLYALFDRRCRAQTALGKLKKLRQWVKRFKWIGDTLNKVFSPNLEKALIFLDDKLLPATSNAVERGNRRHRKMQKSVYRVRSKVCLEGRIALDMIRESRAESRDQTTAALHKARRGYTCPRIFTTVSQKVLFPISLTFKGFRKRVMPAKDFLRRAR